jgi:ATP-binding cassette, subfamily G (WHITE), member 2, PDR
MDSIKEASSPSQVMTSQSTVDDLDDNKEIERSPCSPDSDDGGHVTESLWDPARGRKRSAGIAYRNLNVYGFGTTTDYQKTFATYPFVCFNMLAKLFGRQKKSRIDILQDFEGVVESGEMLMVLGKPGSGCTSFLKALAGQTHGFFIDPNSEMNYQGKPGIKPLLASLSDQELPGVPQDVMQKEFRGECSYQAESDIHFPQLTVKQTLNIAARARAPANAGTKVDREAYAIEERDATIAALGLSGTINVKVGNDFIRGISGGERKRTSIAEVLVCGASLQCWDNSTRGLDSANALKFTHILRRSTRLTGSVAIVTMYQASQNICNLFDKIVLLYEGRQIFFGTAEAARTYFTNLGFVCSERATTSDFLTSLTNPVERVVLEGFESRVPRSSDDFAQIWKQSLERAGLLEQIQMYGTTFPTGKGHLQRLRNSQKVHKADGQRRRSPYTISFQDQIFLCITRGFQRLANDLAPPISSIAGNAILSIVLGSIFYNMPADTSSFYGRGVLLFFMVLTNTFLGAFEGVQLWDQRPIVEKHFQYALYHPSAEAIASMLCDVPNKVLLTTFFNVPFYFLANMRRDPGAFLTFYLFAFVSLLTGSMLFRTIGAMSKTLTSSIAPGATFILMLVIYTGFALPIPSMPPWFRWFGYLDPVGYAFESLMINEFSGRQFSCATMVPQGPGYSKVPSNHQMCAAVGAKPGSAEVSGDAYLAASFQYYPGHLWRNLGIIFSIMAVLCGLYLLATEYVSAQRSKGEVLIFRRGHIPHMKHRDDGEAQALYEKRITYAANGEEQPKSSRETIGMETHGANLLWDGLCYDVRVREGSRRLLDDVEGWIKPGTLTALMGASGAGKTTLLNILANRSSTGVIGGDKLVDDKYQDDGFARKVGYAQQEDLHLATTTVREALIFSARLRQPIKYSDAEKLAWVDQVIDTLDMSGFSEAVVGVPGEGLNVEQRKRVTIGVELAARPELLLFLDEPTSGLDSNTAWSICTLLRKLADNGQAILCTIHQPSELLFRMFDRLLFLVDGKSIYFGEVGCDSRILINYFEQHGARKCGLEENPAEWLLDITAKNRSSKDDIAWPEVWQASKERQGVKETIEAMKKALSREVADAKDATSNEFASSFMYQLYIVTRRNLEHNWRTPSYLYSKLFLTAGAVSTSPAT